MATRLYKIVDDSGIEDVIRISETNTGLGIFAVRPYPASAVIGEITGELIRNRSTGSEYSFDLEDGLQLEPGEPFRYVNHCCDPNCEFDWMDVETANGQELRRVFLTAARDIYVHEQLTIDYNWPATSAIACDCRSPLCRGWVVAEDLVGEVVRRQRDRQERKNDATTP